MEEQTAREGATEREKEGEGATDGRSGGAEEEGWGTDRKREAKTSCSQRVD